ncbi:MAG: hypothetical protein M1820_004467 [Bogoriella megaspora]|nr:MAG: hypothetical protein M1820_004467 [Bogoriella megaspora]
MATKLLPSYTRALLSARRTLPLARQYAAQATPEASPGQSSNVRNSPSSSPESQQVNASRAMDSRSSSDTASVQRPITNPQEVSMGAQEEPQPSQDRMKNDPSEPAEVKRKRVEEEGKKPLDPANK